MANVKKKVKSKSSSEKSNIEKIVSTGNKNKTNLRCPKELLHVTPEEKIQYLLRNSHLIKDKFFNEMTLKQGRLEKDAIIIDKKTITTTHKKHSLKFLDHILKSELMITDTNKSQKQVKHSNDTNNRDNNNDKDISDQNNIESRTDREKLDVNKSKQVNISDETHKLVEIKTKNNSNKKKEKKSKNLDKKKKSIKKKTKTNNPDEETKSNLVDRLNKINNVRLSTGAVVCLTPFECDYCHQSLTTKSSLRRHMILHLEKKPFTCEHCPAKFTQRYTLRNHVYKYHPQFASKTKLGCTICAKTFNLKEDYDYHMDHSHKLLGCDFCDKRFATEQLLNEHEKEHSATGKYHCVCGMSFDRRSRFSAHNKTHVLLQDYVCQYCGKAFLKMNSIRRHVQVCHSGVRIQCPICKKQLRGHLSEHMRTHEKKRPHACPDCGQKFTQSTQLNVHMRSHSGAKPYPCRICKRPFTHSNALVLHIRRHTGEKPYPCAMCPMSFSQIPHMKCHMRNIHGKTKAYKCSKCLKFFKLRAELEMHTKTCKNEKVKMTLEEQIQASVQYDEIESVMSISRMRFLLALLFTMIATKDKLKFLGFNKRLIDDLLVESLEAMGRTPCKDASLTPLMRLKTNIASLLERTVPKEEMKKFKRENKSTEELLELLTNENRTNHHRKLC